MAVTDETTKYKEILLDNGITEKVSEVIVADAGLQGEGFASKTQYVTVKFENSEKFPLNLFVKVISKSESHTELLRDMKAFEKEARFLTEYVPAAQEMWKAKGLEGPLDIYPKCYYGDTKMIVMENLVLDGGYCLLKKEDRQDLPAAKLALQTLAKHQAVSYAMIQDAGGPNLFFERFPDLDHESFALPQFQAMMGPTFANAIDSNIKILENNAVEGRDEALDFFKSHQKMSLSGGMVTCLQLKQEEDDLLLLNHGDYWNNNMLFLKDAQGQVIDHKAVDLQVTRYNSLTLDLTYYMYSSVKTDVRLAHLKELLEGYLGTLKKVSADLGYPISLTYEQLFRQYRRRIDFGFPFCLCMVIGPGMEVIKDIDINTLEVKNWAATFDKLIQKWIEANPQYANGMAVELVKLAEEYQAVALKEEN